MVLPAKVLTHIVTRPDNKSADRLKTKTETDHDTQKFDQSTSKMEPSKANQTKQLTTSLTSSMCMCMYADSTSGRI